MGLDNCRKITEVLARASKSTKELDELEQSYKVKEESITSSLRDCVSQLAVLSDTRATRAQVIRGFCKE